jgi:hypothetical protein
VCLPVYVEQHKTDNTHVQQMYSASHLMRVIRR